MGKNKDKQSQTMGKIAAINTLLERYPILTVNDPMLNSFSINFSLGFLLEVLAILGVTKADIIDWLCKILGGDEGKGDGFLTYVEYAIKGILLVNVRNVLTCAINPNLPDNILKYAHQNGRPETWNPVGITINLNAIDLFGLLNNCPSNEKGGVFYFDAYESNYTPNDLYKSKDFNAFLWYVINKGNITNATNTLKNTWDNRIKASKIYDNNIKLKQKFFDNTNPISKNEKTGPNILIDDGLGNTLEKKQYVICEYAETNGGVIKVFLNADRYYKTRRLPLSKRKIVVKSKQFDTEITLKLKNKNQYITINNVNYYLWVGKKSNIDVEIYTDNIENPQKLYLDPPTPTNDYVLTEYKDGAIDMNRTIFEFNYDYIYSLKLFDTKTILANICNSLLGLASTVSISYSHEQLILKEKIGDIVKNIIREDDTEISDCYFTFSNDAYNDLLEKTTREYNGKYTNPNNTYNPEFNDVFNSLMNVNSQSNKETNQKKKIGNVIEQVFNTSSSMKNESVDSFSFNFDFIQNFLEQTITEIILQVLSPKVSMLYAINSAILGDVTNVSGMDNLMKDLKNLLVSIIKQVKDLLIEEMYNYVMSQLAPILNLFISKLALETIKAYKDLITDLIKNCIPSLSFGGNTEGINIDNINYADIVPKENNPVKNNC